MLIFILIDVQCVQKNVFSFEKGRMVKITLRQIASPNTKNLPQQNFPYPLPFNAIWKTLVYQFHQNRLVRTYDTY